MKIAKKNSKYMHDYSFRKENKKKFFGMKFTSQLYS